MNVNMLGKGLVRQLLLVLLLWPAAMLWSPAIGAERVPYLNLSCGTRAFSCFLKPTIVPASLPSPFTKPGKHTAERKRLFAERDKRSAAKNYTFKVYTTDEVLTTTQTKKLVRDAEIRITKKLAGIVPKFYTELRIQIIGAIKADLKKQIKAEVMADICNRLSEPDRSRICPP